MAKKHQLPPPPDDAYRCHVDPMGRRWHVFMEWGEIGGRYEVVGVRVHSDARKVPLKADDLRRMPLGTMFTEAKRSIAASIVRMADKHGDSPDEARDLASAWGPQRGRALDRSALERVADAYNRAVASYMPVTQAVAEACHVSRSTAGKRIMAAREAGLIPEAKR